MLSCSSEVPLAFSSYCLNGILSLDVPLVSNFLFLMCLVVGNTLIIWYHVKGTSWSKEKKCCTSDAAVCWGGKEWFAGLLEISTTGEGIQLSLKANLGIQTSLDFIHICPISESFMFSQMLAFCVYTSTGTLVPSFNKILGSYLFILGNCRLLIFIMHRATDTVLLDVLSLWTCYFISSIS